MCSGSESEGAAALAGRLCGGGVGVGVCTEVSAARRIDVGDEADESEADDEGVVGACAEARGDGETVAITVDDGAAELLPPLPARGEAATKADMGRRKPPGAGDEKGACTVDAD